MDCSNCEWPNLDTGEFCPKCDTEIVEHRDGGLAYVDIAHSGEDWESAKEKLERATDLAFCNKTIGLKVIHGWGSQLGHSKVIGAKIKPILKSLAKLYGGKLVQDKTTKGAHLIYFN